MITPWGKSQGKEIVATGITFYSTAGHGGYYVSKAMRSIMPARYVNHDGWYEEDCEWAKVALSFPYLFTPSIVEAAATTFRHWCNDDGTYRNHEVQTLPASEL